MSYHRKSIILPAHMPRRMLHGFGDVITDPSQVDPSLTTTSGGDPIVGTVQADRKSCDQLSPDSPWRQPGQVCGPPVSNWFTDWVDSLKNLFGPAPTSPAPPPSTEPSSSSAGAAAQASDGIDTSKLLLLAGLGGAAYWYFTKKKKRG